jgi:hypothetical protein
MSICVVKPIGIDFNRLIDRLKDKLDIEINLSVPAFCEELIYLRDSSRNESGLQSELDGVYDSFGDSSGYADEFSFLNDLNLKKCAIIYIDFNSKRGNYFTSASMLDNSLMGKLHLRVYHVGISSMLSRDKQLDSLASDLSSFFARSNPKAAFPRIPKIPNCPSIVTDDSTMPPQYNEQGITDYPNKGDNEKIHFRNSKFKMFPFKLALDIMEAMPDMWCKGGNQFGNLAFSYWIKAMRAMHNGKAIPKDSQRWIKKREGYIARHRADKRPAGVIAMIKWAGFVDGEGSHANGAVDGSSLQMMLDVIGYSK